MIKTHSPIKSTAKRHNASTGQRGRSSLYGSKWQRLRIYFLKRNPLCKQCLSKRITQIATEVDHIQPHHGNMELFYKLDNLQALCKSCHSRKTLSENSGGFQTASMIPSWLPITTKPLIVVCGRPMSGIEKYITDNKGNDDLVIDLVAMAEVEGKSFFELEPSEKNLLIRKRNEILAKFMRGNTRHDKCFLSVTAGNPKHREFWKDKGAEVVVMQTTIDVCQRTINQMDLPVKVKVSLMQAAQDWQ